MKGTGGGSRDVEVGSVDAGEVDRAGGLPVLGFEAERHDVHLSVFLGAGVELGGHQPTEVLTVHAIRAVKGLVVKPQVHVGDLVKTSKISGGGSGIRHDEAVERLGGVVKVERVSVTVRGGRRSGLREGHVLSLGDEKLVRPGGEHATLVIVEENVSADEIRLDGTSPGSAARRGRLGEQIRRRLKLDVHLGVVVLKRDDGKRLTPVGGSAGKVQGDVHDLRIRRAGHGSHVVARVDVGHILGAREPIPNVHPVTGERLDGVVADGERHLIDHRATEIRSPSTVTSRRIDHDLKHELGDEITGALDGEGHLTTESGGTGLLHHHVVLHGEVGVTSVLGLEIGDLGLTGEESILRTTGAENHDWSRHVCLGFCTAIPHTFLFSLVERVSTLFPWECAPRPSSLAFDRDTKYMCVTIYRLVTSR